MGEEKEGDDGRGEKRGERRGEERRGEERRGEEITDSFAHRSTAGSVADHHVCC